MNTGTNANSGTFQAPIRRSKLQTDSNVPINCHNTFSSAALEQNPYQPRFSAKSSFRGNGLNDYSNQCDTNVVYEPPPCSSQSVMNCCLPSLSCGGDDITTSPGRIFLIEFIAMTIFLTLILQVASNSTDLLTIAFVHGFALAAVIGTFSSEKAGFVNPLIVLMLCAMGELHPKKPWMFLIYWLAEILGSCVAVVIVLLLTPGYDTSLGLGSPNISSQVDLFQAFFAEFWGSFVLYSIIVWIVCLDNYYKMVSHSGSKHYKVASNTILPIGMIFIAIVICIAPYTGASLNIFRWFFPKLISNTWTSNDWVYFVGPLAAAFVVGSLAYLILKTWRPRTTNI